MIIYYSKDANPDLKENSTPIEIGDIIEQTSSCSGTTRGNHYPITKNSIGDLRADSCGCTTQWKLIKKVNGQNPKYTLMTSVKQAFKDLLTSEPKKSLKKAGIITESGDFTIEGQGVFLEWLLNRKDLSEAFMKEVVTPILDEEKKNKA